MLFGYVFGNTSHNLHSKFALGNCSFYQRHSHSSLKSVLLYVLLEHARLEDATLYFYSQLNLKIYTLRFVNILYWKRLNRNPVLTLEKPKDWKDRKSRDRAQLTDDPSSCDYLYIYPGRTTKYTAYRIHVYGPQFSPTKIDHISDLSY